MKWITLVLLGWSVSAAYASPNQVSGLVFQDLNENGINTMEPGLAGARVTLDGTGSTVFDAEQITGSNGAFLFTGLPDGSFELCVQAPEATPPWVATTATCYQFSLNGGKNPVSASRSFGFHRDEDEIEGCTRTQGYWGSSPAGQTLLATLVGAEPGGQMLLGSVGYSATELQDILDASVSTPGPGANALISLAHQLIAAKANRLNGASAPQSVLDAIAAADLLIGTSDMSPVGSSPSIDPSSTQGQAMDVQKTILDTYNNGDTQGGPPHCEDRGRRPRVKSSEL
jgi:hypothetical protein